MVRLSMEYVIIGLGLYVLGVVITGGWRTDPRSRDPNDPYYGLSDSDIRRIERDNRR